MEVKEHKESFDAIIKKYGLSDRAEEISEFLTKHSAEKISAAEFGQLFGMDTEEAEVFLGWIEKGLRFKEKHVDE